MTNASAPKDDYSKHWHAPCPLTLCRVSRGLNQRELAELSGVTRETINRLERFACTPQWSTAKALSKVLGYPESVLFADRE